MVDLTKVDVHCLLGRVGPNLLFYFPYIFKFIDFLGRHPTRSPHHTSPEVEVNRRLENRQNKKQVQWNVEQKQKLRCYLMMSGPLNTYCPQITECQDL